MKEIIAFLAANRDVDFIGIGWRNNAAHVFGHYRNSNTGFRVHNVGNIDGVIRFLQANPEVKTVKFALRDNGDFVLRACASISDQLFEIEGIISEPEPGETYVSPMKQFQEWLDNFAKKLAKLRRDFAKRHRPTPA